MKKYLTAFIAIIVAIGLSAFSLPKKTTAENLTTYWWYELNGEKTHTTGDPVNESKQTEGDMIGDYVVCEDDGEPACLAGFEDEVISPESISELDEGEIIRETD
jgi:hypothetical protein